MSKSLLHSTLLFVLTTMVILCGGLGDDGEDGTNYETIGYDDYFRRMISLRIKSSLENEYNGLGISAWGIIAVVISFILAVVGMYYISICYPVICKKSKKYDTMGLTPVV